MNFRWGKCFLLLVSLQVFLLEGKECDRQFMQRCDTCTVRDDLCLPIEERKLYVTDHCKELCERNATCHLAEYHSPNSTCMLYDCTSLRIGSGYTSITFRRACSEDCSKFRLTIEDQRNDSISACTLDNLGRLRNPACMAECFDTDDCRALIYPQRAYDCMLCSSTEVMAFDVVDTNLDEARLMRRICITDEPRNNTQICLNCDKGSLCQDRFDELEVYNASSCNEACTINADCKLSVYESRENKCKLYDCSLVQENIDMVVYRKSTSIDCPVFEISILNGFYGACTIVAVVMHVPMFEYCIDKCLDMPGCRGASYTNTKGKKCRLHGCDSYKPSTQDSFFMKRKCKDHLQPMTTIQTTDSGKAHLTALVSQETTSKRKDNLVKALILLSGTAFLSGKSFTTSPPANESTMKTVGKLFIAAAISKESMFENNSQITMPSATIISDLNTRVQARTEKLTGSPSQLSQSPSTLSFGRSPSQSSELTSSIITHIRQTSNGQNDSVADLLYKVVASSVSGFIAITCVGPLILYCLFCRKKRIKSCSPEK